MSHLSDCHIPVQEFAIFPINPLTCLSDYKLAILWKRKEHLCNKPNKQSVDYDRLVLSSNIPQKGHLWEINT